MRLVNVVCWLGLAALPLVACKKKTPGKAKVANAKLEALDVCDTMAAEMRSLDSQRDAFNTHLSKLLRPRLEMGCRQKRGILCTALAIQVQFGQGGSDESGRADKLFAQAAGLLASDCRKNNARACENLGNIHRYARGVLRNKEKGWQLMRRARTLYAAACDRGDGKSCIRLYRLSPARTKKGARVQSDPLRKGMPLLEKACLAAMPVS